MNVNKNLGKKKIRHMFPINVCLFDALSETILLSGQCYLHLDLVLAQVPSFHVYFSLSISEGKTAPELCKTGLPLHNQQSTCPVFLSDFLKLSIVSMNFKIFTKKSFRSVTNQFIHEDSITIINMLVKRLKVTKHGFPKGLF